MQAAQITTSGIASPAKFDAGLGHDPADREV
jgi:hypothetical protein